RTPQGDGLRLGTNICRQQNLQVGVGTDRSAGPIVDGDVVGTGLVRSEVVQSENRAGSPFDVRAVESPLIEERLAAVRRDAEGGRLRCNSILVDRLRSDARRRAPGVALACAGYARRPVDWIVAIG